MSHQLCWICGGVADTREHMIKASDIRSVFPAIGKNNPAYINYQKGEVRKTVYAAKSKSLTYKNKICSRCNNDLTQPYDKAWESLSSYIKILKPSANCNCTINLSNVFPATVRSSMKDVQLYFCKMFGCMVSDYKVPFDLTEVASCLLNRKSYNNIELLLVGNSGHTKKKMALITPMTAVSMCNKIQYVFWLYNVNVFSVVVAYSAGIGSVPGFKFGWHPDRVGKKVTIQALNTWRVS